MQTIEESPNEDFKPRFYQSQMKDICLAKNTIVYLPTGAGKTHIALMAIRELGRLGHLDNNTNTATIPTTSVLQKPTEPPKIPTKSKRKREIKRPLKIRLLPPKRTRGKTATTTSNSKLTCSTCKKSFSSKSTLKAHVETHKSKEKQQYTCEKCNQIFKSSSSLAKHERSHVGEKPASDRSRRGNSSSSASTLKTRTSRVTAMQGRASVRAGTKRVGGSRN